MKVGVFSEFQAEVLSEMSQLQMSGSSDVVVSVTTGEAERVAGALASTSEDWEDYMRCIHGKPGRPRVHAPSTRCACPVLLATPSATKGRTCARSYGL